VAVIVSDAGLAGIAVPAGALAFLVIAPGAAAATEPVRIPARGADRVVTPDPGPATAADAGGVSRIRAGAVAATGHDTAEGVEQARLALAVGLAAVVARRTPLRRTVAAIFPPILPVIAAAVPAGAA